jgi:hypothetical protein
VREATEDSEFRRAVASVRGDGGRRWR